MPKNAGYRGGVTCLYDTQLLGACLHAPESGGRSRPEAVRGMPDVPIAPPGTGPREGSGPQAQPGVGCRLGQPSLVFYTRGRGRVCLGFWALFLCFWGRNESGSGLSTVRKRKNGSSRLAYL